MIALGIKIFVIFFLANKNNLMMDFFLDDNNILDSQDKKHNSDRTNNNEVGKVERIFIAINAHLSNELVNRTGAIYQFNVKGNFFSFLDSNIKT